MPGPLEGIVVTDLSRILTGPYATMMLADFGADVIKVESPQGGDDTRSWGPPFVEGESSYFLSINRNKRSLTLNLKHSDGQDVLRRLLERSDVLVENFRPGTLDRLGFSDDVLLALNPRLIIAHISGFGRSGPYRDRPGYDVIAQGMSGLMSVTGSPDGGPVKVGFSVGDIGAGMWAAFGVLLALQARQSTGRGQVVDSSLLGALVSWQTYIASNFFASGKVPGPLGSAHPNIAPYQAMPTSDGHINIAVGNDNLWQRFCSAIGRSDLLAVPEYQSNAGRVKARSRLISDLETTFRQQTSSFWLSALEGAGVPAGPIYTIDQVFEDEGVQALGLLQSLEHPVAGTVQQVGIPLRLSETPGGVRTAPPTLGQHTDDVLRELGFNDGQIACLRSDGVIA